LLTGLDEGDYGEPTIAALEASGARVERG